MAKQLSAQDSADIQEAREAYKAYVSHFDEPSAPKEEKKVSTGGSGQAFLEHLGNAASLGYLPQISAITEPVTSRIFDAITGNNISEDMPSYVNRRDAVSSRLKQQEQENPTASTLGSIGGGLSGGLALSSILPGAAAAKGLGQVVAQGAKTGAIIGAASNPGETEGDVSPLQLGDRAKNAAISGALGGAISAAGEGVKSGGKYLANKFKDIAEKKAFKALGPYQRDAINNADNVNDIGRAALDSKVISGVPKSYEKLAEKASEAKGDVGQKIGSIIKELSQDPNLEKVSRNDIVKRIAEDVTLPEGVAGAGAKNRQINALIDEFVANNPEEMSLLQANSLKTNTGNEINWKRLFGSDIPVTEQVQRASYGALKDAENSIAKKASESGTNQTAKDFVKSKEAYGNLSTAANIAGKRAEKESANRVLGLTDYISGGIGTALGTAIAGPPGGLVGGVIGTAANKLGRTYGNQAVAVASNNISRKLAELSPKIAAKIQNNPAVMASLIQQELRHDEPAQEQNELDPIQRRLVRLNQGRAPAKGIK